MSQATLCPVCKGYQMITGMGGMQRKCYHCNAIGYVGMPQNTPSAPDDSENKKLLEDLQKLADAYEEVCDKNKKLEQEIKELKQKPNVKKAKKAA